VYTLWGYTFEPAFNLWSLRWSVVKVYNSDPHSVGPAAAVTTPSLALFVGDEAPIEGCVHAADGATMTFSYAILGNDPDAEYQWVPFAEDVPVSGEAFSVPFVAADEHAGSAMMVRVVIEEPGGASYTAYMNELVNVTVGPNPGCDDEGGSGSNFISNPCDETGGGTTGDSGSTTGESGGDPTSGSSTTAMTVGETPDTGGSGCSCTASGSRSGGALAGLLVLVAGRVRRRRPLSS
jgi:MYXO-CTERM domain-containing protein